MTYWIDTDLPLKQYEISFIRGQKLFRNLKEDQFQSLISKGKAIRLRKGDNLYEKNQPASYVFVLIEGLIKLTRTSVDGDEKVIDVVKPKRTIAATALLTSNQVYSEDASAICRSRIIAISTSKYFSFLKSSPALCVNLMEITSDHVQWLVDEIDRITLHDAEYRLISYLLEEAKNGDQYLTEFQLSTPKIIIASRLSIKPETLSRVLRSLASQDLIDYHNGGVFKLKDVPKLKEMLSTEMPRHLYT